MGNGDAKAATSGVHGLWAACLHRPGMNDFAGKLCGNEYESLFDALGFALIEARLVHDTMTRRRTSAVS